MNEKMLIIIIALFSAVSILLIKEPSYTGNVISDQSSLTINVQNNKTTTEYLTIKNNQKDVISVNIEKDGLEGLLFITDNKIKLKPNEERQIELNIIGKENGDFSGSLRLESQEIDKIIPIKIKVYPDLLLNVNVKVNDANKKIRLGEQLTALIEIDTNGVQNSTNLTVLYYITDINNNIMHEEQDIISIEGKSQISQFTKTFTAASHFDSGDYLIEVDIKYGNTYATASDMFSIENAAHKLSPFNNKLLVNNNNAVIFILFMLAAIGILFIIRKLRKVII